MSRATKRPYVLLLLSTVNDSLLFLFFVIGLADVTTLKTHRAVTPLSLTDAVVLPSISPSFLITTLSQDT